MSYKLVIPAVLASLSLVGIGVTADRYVNVRHVDTVTTGRVAKPATAELLLSRDTNRADAGGWRGFFVPSGDMVLTWSTGKQEVFVGGGSKPCIVGCMAMYGDAMRSFQNAQRADAAPPEPTDKLGDGWITDVSGCAHACDTAGAIVWPGPPKR